MTDEQQPYSWIGQAVVLHRASNPTYGTLEAMGEYGAVMLHAVGMASGSTPQDQYGGQHTESRTVAEFFPWHTVSSIRPLEPEERQEHGLD